MIKYKSKLREVIFYNRWKQRKHSRNGDWTLFGLSRWACSYEEYSYKLCFFGFEVHLWFKKIFLSGATVKRAKACPDCQGTGKDGHDRCDPPNWYVCSKCNGQGKIE